VTVNPERMNISDNTAVLYVPCCPLMLLLFQKANPEYLLNIKIYLTSKGFLKLFLFFQTKLTSKVVISD
jgi:hypothetical protein